ncbi:MAG TPA: choice-of-anchor Q domain-containing protein, partial [Nevskia sp.]|nr:choice-of-anchor Q domain-containing protein [Nevskia sp.]
LAVNGGPTLTMMPASSPSKSPALDTGEVIPPPSGTDQRGLPRSANGRRDMGAVERQYPEDVVFRNGFDSS